MFHRGEKEEHVRDINKTEEGGQSRYEAWYEAKATSARGVLVPWALLASLLWARIDWYAHAP